MPAGLQSDNLLPGEEGAAMKRQAAFLTCAAIGLAIGSFAAETQSPRRIMLQVLEDKIKGGWAGQMIGVSYGAPTEFKAKGRINEGNLTWSPERVSNAIQQDDLYVEMTFAEVMDKKGLDATSEDYGEMFKNSKYSLWHANAAARRLLNDGIKAPLSGDPRYNAHANDIDFQIESDFIGLMTPGLPQEANKYADRVGRVMNYGDGLYGGMFFGGMYAAAFFEQDVRTVVEKGLASIPAQSRYGKIIRDLLDWHAGNPEDWRKTWQLIEDKWDKDDPCPDGALTDFNIDASLNGAYVALGLLYGNKDFGQTVEIAARAGQDSDCNPSSAAGILGVMLGYEKIPDFWKSGIPALADTKFQFTNYSFNQICQSTLDRALKVVRGAGGKVEGDEVNIPYQLSKAPVLEQWDPGIPDRRIKVDDSSWTWKGSWNDEAKGAGKSTSDAGAEAELNFTGTAIILIGPYSQSGGRADVYLDGKKAGEINAYIVPRTNDDALWHTYGLDQGTHTVRVVKRSDADARSKGNRLTLQSAVVFRPRPSASLTAGVPEGPRAVAKPLREPIRTSGILGADRLICRVEPDYPDLARKARVAGAVILQVTVNEAGEVWEVKVVKGPPLLQTPALTAVKKWRYRPTYVNGAAVPVIMTVTVTFHLGDTPKKSGSPATD